MEDPHKGVPDVDLDLILNWGAHQLFSNALRWFDLEMNQSTAGGRTLRFKGNEETRRSLNRRYHEVPYRIALDG